jgi:hypothetical protein
MRHRLLISARSILFGWATLLVVTNLVEHPLLFWSEPLLGASWFPTVQLILECVALAASGWIIGRWNQLDAMRVTLVFAVMLAIWDFGLVPAINLRWLFQLTIDVIKSLRYLESFITALAAHALLFGSLITGARLSRPRQTKPLSIVDETEADKDQVEVDRMDDHE